MDLQERMTKTVNGQVTWADPDLGKKCIECRHSGWHDRPKMPHNRHQCALVAVHTGKKGEPFNANLAIACSKFAPLDGSTSNM